MDKLFKDVNIKSIKRLLTPKQIKRFVAEYSYKY